MGRRQRSRTIALRNIRPLRASHASSRLVSVDLDGRIAVFDSRESWSGPEVVVLDSIEARVLTACDTVGTIPALVHSMPGSTAEEVTAAVQQLCRRGFMVVRADRCLALPVALPGFLEARAQNLARSDGG
jgi:hypothetical protein